MKKLNVFARAGAQTGRLHLAIFFVLFLANTQIVCAFTLEEKEQFLLNGKVTKESFIPVGITHPVRVTLEYEGVTHDAHIQTIDEDLSLVRGSNRNTGSRDYYGFNIAAYQLDKLLGLNMTPASVKRKFNGKWAAVTWWVDDVAMTNLERIQKKIEPPDLATWNQQIEIVLVINQLLADADPNMSNVLITKDWKIWMVDRTRAFQAVPDLQNPKVLTKCDRHLLGALKTLDGKILKEKLGDYLSKSELEALDRRRKAIVKIFEDEIAAKGEASVLFDAAR